MLVNSAPKTPSNREKKTQDGGAASVIATKTHLGRGPRPPAGRQK